MSPTEIIPTLAMTIDAIYKQSIKHPLVDKTRSSNLCARLPRSGCGADDPRTRVVPACLLDAGCDRRLQHPPRLCDVPIDGVAQILPAHRKPSSMSLQ